MNRFVPVQSLPDLVLLADAAGTNLQASAPLCRLLGRTEDELRGLSLPQALPGWSELPEVWAALQKDQKPRQGLSGTLGSSRFLLSLEPSRDKHRGLGGVIVRLTGAENWDEAFERFGISAREKEVCRLLLEGQTNQQIADKLFISPGTVKNHLQNLFRKTGAANRVELLRVLQKP
jgi:DNA-binding CsgD family transcriptional regulator